MQQAEENLDRGRHVLVVEDETRLRNMLARAVRDMEFVTTSVATAEQALTILDEEPRDIVMSDLNLPDMQGMELCDVIRQRWPQTQLIILTGYGTLEAARQAIRLDVVDFLTKPCALGDVEAALDRALRRRLSGIIPRLFAEGDWAEGLDQEHVSGDCPQTLKDIEREHIIAVLDRFDGNRDAAAEALGISVRTLYYRITEYQRQGFIHS